MKLDEALAGLYALAPRGALLGLDRVRAAAEKLGNLHQLNRYVHIAGTNGKGSTAAFAASMGHRAGGKVGLYTSPHLCRFAERIRINGEPVADDQLAHALETVLAISDELTFFEVATLAALLVFRESSVDLTVLEVGLGGRLDATNVVEGAGVQAITRIAFDHVDRLGDSIASIAREKAGILRAGSLCVVGRLHPDARAEIDREAARVGAHIYEATTRAESHVVEGYPPALAGGFQRQNAMVAVAIGHALGISEEAIGEGLSKTKWPGRCEVIETPEGYVLLDCAHNADGALALKNTLAGFGMSFPRKQIALVFGAMADKNWKAMLDRLGGASGTRVYVEPGGRAPAKIAELTAYLSGSSAPDAQAAMALARKQVGRGGLVVVAGSIFLVGAARAALFGLVCDPPVAL